MTVDDAHFVAHEPCPACGSRDNLARYSDGSAHCFGCKHHEHPSDNPTPSPKGKPMTSDLIDDLEILPIPSRKLTLKTADRFGYAMGKDHKGRACHVSPYYRDGKLVAQHLRYPGKNFRIVGDTKELPFFGQRHCSGSGRRIVVTEGQLDAMSVDQVLGNKWPVVSVPHGTGSATKCVKNNIAFLEGYDEVVFMFDMDEPGQEAALECARLLSPARP